MRFPSPTPTTLKRAELLDYVREELRRRYPSFAGVMDIPGDPGWMLLEQAAWMAQATSEVLSEQPREVIEYLLALLGRDLRPATPAIGVVALQVEQHGCLDNREAPALFAPTTSGREQVDFALVERLVPLVVGRITGCYRLTRGQLVGQHVERVDFPHGQVLLRPRERDLSLVDKERIVYRIERHLDPVLEGVLDKLVAAFSTGSAADVGWLSASWETRGAGIDLTLEIDVAAPFPEEGVDRRPHTFGRIADWRPEVLTRPGLPGVAAVLDSSGLPALLECPPETPARELVRPGAVAPDPFPQALWEHVRVILANDGQQLPHAPSWTRAVTSAERTPRWLQELPFTSHWARISESSGALLSLKVPQLPRDGELRVALVLDGAAVDYRPPLIEVLLANGTAGRVDAEWSAVLPRPRALGPGVAHVAVYRLTAEHVRPLGTVVLHQVRQGPNGGGRLLGAILNPALVLNAPEGHDGRTVRVGLKAGEIDLLWPDLVDQRVLARVAEGFPGATARPLREMLDRLEVAKLSVRKQGVLQEELRDWSRMRLDPSVGRAQFGVPDHRGERALPAGVDVQVRSYRRTSGARGNLDEGQVIGFEQAETDRPRILGVTNPLPTHLGEDTESASQAVYRMFGPERGEVPTVPSDLERIARDGLGPDEQGWMVRVWTHAERVLLDARFWGEEQGPDWIQRGVGRARKRLDELGPHGLLVAIGDPDRLVDEARFVALSAGIQRRIEALADRVPYLRGCVVVPIQPLTLHTREDEAPELPCFRPDRLGVGTVVPLGSDAAFAPKEGVNLWLDAAVTDVETTRAVVEEFVLGPDAPGFEGMELHAW